MKLEPKHIIPYLSHELNWDLSETEYGKLEKHRLEWCKLIGINVSDTHGDLALRTNIETQNKGFLYVNLDVGKPILRSLSDLTKEIEHNGEKFVPLLELANISFPKFVNSDRFTLVDNYIDMGYEYAFLYKMDYMSFVCYTEYNGKSYSYACVVPEQYKMFQKLFEWHFNVFNLPEHLWININD